jgi:hypothetical protein
MDAITIHIQVIPDFVITHEYTEKTYNSAKSKRHSYLLAHNMVVVEELDSDGNRIRYSDVRYLGCRVYAGKIQMLDSKQGWVNDEDATKIYMEEIADKALLGQ